VNPVPFEVQREELEGGIRAFKVRGELDMNTAPELEERLEEAISSEDALVILDLTECEFIDSTGIALVVRTWQRLDRAGEGGGNGRLVICSVNAQVMRLLKITGVESSIPLYEQREQALAGLRDDAAAKPTQSD
jgi:anti-sigma B factor antagonist